VRRPKDDGDRLAGLAECHRRVLEGGALVGRQGAQQLLVSADVADDHVELAGEVVDGPCCGARRDHGLAFSSQVIGVGSQLGQIGGVGLEVGARRALVADRAGLAAGAHVGRL
jgi:hypothetical protein